MRAMGSLFSLAKWFEDFRMPCGLLGPRQSGGAHDRGQVAPRFFELFVYYNIIKFFQVADFLAGIPQPALYGLLAVLAPPSQPALEFLQHGGRRKDENADRVGESLADLPGALPVDLEHDVRAAGARVRDPLPRCAVAVSVDFGRLEEL